MRYLDTNVLVDALIDQGTRTRSASEALLDRFRLGQEELATTELMLSEAVFLLRTSRGGRLAPRRIADVLIPIIQSPHLHVPNKETWVKALETMAEHRVDLSDAYMTVVMEENSETELYSLDSDFDRIPGIKRIEP